MIKKILAAFCVSCLVSGTLSAQTINTIAGNGTAGYAGDGGPGIAASFYSVMDILPDANGNIFVADQKNHAVRKINASGIITTLAGGNSYGYSGDGGPATAAQLDQPQGLALDNAGNLFIADKNNNCVRKVDNNGTITTIAGGNGVGYSGDNGPAINATFKSPGYLAFDALGNLYVADQGNQVVRKIDGTGTITTYAGNGSAGFSGDGGSATSAKFNGVSGIALNSAGDLYIADFFNHRIRMVNSAGIISTVAGTGTMGYSGDGAQATSAQINSPVNVAVDANDALLISEYINSTVRKVTASGIILTIAGTGVSGFGGDGGSATNAMLNIPVSARAATTGNVYIADRGNSRIRKIDFNTNAQTFNKPGNSLQVSPVPNNGTFTLSGTSGAPGSIQFEITDVTGKIILKDNAAVTNGKINKLINMDNTTPAGQYFLRIIDKNGISTIKFEKK